MLYLSGIKDKIISETFIKEVLYFNTISSTNDYCRSSANNDTLVVTGFQTGGKGRFSRKWESEPNKNLLFSIKKTFNKHYKNYFSITYFFTYFLLDSLINLLQKNNTNFKKESFEIKWPNDILYDSKKLSGILVESNVNKKEFIIGIGVNINQTNFDRLYNLQTTSLKQITNSELNLNMLLLETILNFSNNLHFLTGDKDIEIYKLWKSQCKMIGKTVKFSKSDNTEDKAQIIDINEDGSIKLLKDGEYSNFYSGEIKINTN